MPAALLMTLTVGLLGAESRSAGSPAELLTRMGASLLPHCERSRLNVAVCYALLQSEGTVRVANAGGIAPLVRRVNGRLEWMDTHGLPLGIEFTGGPLVEQEVHLGPGDTLVMITDGLLEAKSEAGEMFSFERFEHAVVGATLGAVATQEYILNALRAFTVPVEPDDDVTVVVVVKQ
jgi:serine phosphatase RsbU (regulator of sigma subunit)